LSAAAPVVIETRGLTRRFGEVLAVDGVDLEVRRGEIFGCLGPNGSGKSTLMRMLLGLLDPSAGSASVLGREIPRDVESLRPAVGYMTQRFSLYEDLSVRENLDFAGRVFGLWGGRLRERVGAVMEQFRLAGQQRKRAAVLSGGWKQRLALAVAVVHQPELLVLDEPTAGVDPQSRREFWEDLFELAGRGATLLVSTHYMDEAVRCHRLCILRDGRRVAVGTPPELMHALEGRVLELRTPRTDAAIARLRASPLVASATQLGDMAHVLLRPGGRAASEAAASLAAELVGAGFAGVEAAAAAPTLEDVFVALLLGEQLGP
jgi:ABC-2 type transport system ATP-binding protein